MTEPVTINFLHWRSIVIRPELTDELRQTALGLAEADQKTARLAAIESMLDPKLPAKVSALIGQSQAVQQIEDSLRMLAGAFDEEGELLDATRACAILVRFLEQLGEEGRRQAFEVQLEAPSWRPFAHRRLVYEESLDRYAPVRMGRAVVAVVAPHGVVPAFALEQMLTIQAPGALPSKVEGELIFTHAAQRLPVRVNLAHPLVHAGVVEQIIATGLPQLSTLDAHRLLWWLVRRCYEQSIVQKHSPNVVLVRGGLQEIADQAGANRHTIAGVLNDIAKLDVRTPGATWINLLMLKEREFIAGGGAYLELTIADCLQPSYIQALAQHSRNSALMRSLVPLLPPAPAVGSPREYGAQVNFQHAIVLAMRACAAELAHSGTVAIAEHDLDMLAVRAGLPKAARPKVMARLLSEPDAMLKSPKAGRYTLSEHHIGAREFIRAAGIEVLKGQKRARRKKPAVPKLPPKKE